MRNKRRIRILVAAASALGAGVASDALAQTWDGGGANDNWTTPLNWDANAVPANNGSANVTFAGATRPTPNVDAAQSVAGLAFAPAAAPFTIGGQALTIGAGGITNNAAATAQTFSNNIVLAAAQPWNAAAGDLVVNGNISDLGTFPGLNKTGAGTLTLRGTNTFKGDVNLNGGTIDVFRVSTQVAHPRTFNFNAASTLRMNATDAANFTAVASAATTLEVTQGWVSVVSLTGASTVAKSGNGYLELGLSNSSYTGRIGVGAGKLIVAANNALGSTVGGTTVSSGASIAFIGGAFGGLNYTSAEPLGISGDGHNGHGAIYNMGFSSNTFAGTISLNAASSISAETLGSSLRLGQIFIGHPLTVRDANVTIAGNISGSNGRLIKSGGGTLTLLGSNSYGGGTEIKGGVLSVNSDSALGSSPNDVTFSGAATLHLSGFLGSKRDLILAADGATVDTNGNDAHVESVNGPYNFTKVGAGNSRAQFIRTGPVNVNAGRMSIVSGVTAGETCTAASLAVAAGAQFDLSDHNLIVTSSTLSAVESLVNAGSNGGTWDGTGGIITTQANALSGRTSLGVATAQQAGYAGGTFAGVSVDADDVIVMYTYAGDANLDGLISGDDYAAIDLNVGIPGASGWFNGDFNHDGIISGDDYAAIDLNIVAQGAPFPTSSAIAGVTAVPEPAMSALLALAPAAMIRRRRRPTLPPGSAAR